MSLYSFIEERKASWHCLLMMGALLWLAGCATSGALREPREPPTRENPSDDGGGFGFLEESRDEFQLLQQSSGLEEGSWHEVGAELETEDAQELWEAMVRSPTKLKTFGPKRSLLFVLRQVLEADEDVPYTGLVQRCRPFLFLVVVRPDGYMASALDGEPLQRAGRVELREGRLVVGGRYEVGAFYRNRGGVFYPVDGALRQSSIIPLGELGLEHDWLNAALDGSEDALAEMVVALAHFIQDPVRSLQGLAQLPSAVAALIASSPEYFARYSTLPLQEQIREAGRLSTHLLMLFGSAAGTATRIGTTGTRLPVLSLTADGALAIERVSVPGGTSAAVLGVGAGAVYVLSSSEKAPNEGNRTATDTNGPGEWRQHRLTSIESWRKPRFTEDGRILPFKDSRQPASPISNLGRNRAGQTVTDGRTTIYFDKDGFPQFETQFETILDNSHIGSGRPDLHIKAANKKLFDAIQSDPELARSLRLSQTQVDQLLAMPKAPEGYAWHHHQDVGRLQLIEQGPHFLARPHTGGMAIWGGGY
jgi:hypothetical protein